MSEKMERSQILFSFIGNLSSLFFQDECLLEKCLFDISQCLSLLITVDIIKRLYIHIFKYRNRSFFNFGISASISFFFFFLQNHLFSQISSPDYVFGINCLLLNMYTHTYTDEQVVICASVCKTVFISGQKSNVYSYIKSLLFLFLFRRSLHVCPSNDQNINSLFFFIHTSL